MIPVSEKFEIASTDALANDRLQRALTRATGGFVAKRKQAAAELPNWQPLRDRARAAKEEVLAHLDDYLQQLEQKVTKLGGHVFFAKNGREACNYISHLAQDHGVQRVAKGKSMTSEEIDLNEALEKVGAHPIETDLGEFIVQLSGDHPSHIIAPIIHKLRDEIGELFHEKLGIEKTDDVPTLCAAARKYLRESFTRADMGISGVNFAVAETGTIVIVENEGNVRLSTTMPRIHVALMGMEKVIPRFDDLAVFLRLLARSATGQRMTGYVSFITGPRRPGELDGPDEFHLVIIDNGRRKIWKDSEMRSSLACIRCGACLNACPVYQKVGGHSYGWVYQGPIGAIITPQYLGLDHARLLPYASSLCGACLEACPVQIDIPTLLLKLRAREIESGMASAGERLVMRVWAFVMMRPGLFAFAGRLAAVFQRPWVRDGKIRRLPGPLGRWTKGRDFPPLAKKSFRALWRDLEKKE